MRHTAFISYSHADRDWMRHVADYLEQLGLEVWMEAELPPGRSSIIGREGNRIGQADVFVVGVSSSSAESRWIQWQLDIALIYEFQHGRPRILPVLLEGAAMPALLADRPYVDVGSSAARDWRQDIRRFVAALEDDTQKHPASVAPGAAGSLPAQDRLLSLLREGARVGADVAHVAGRRPPDPAAPDEPAPAKPAPAPPPSEYDDRMQLPVPRSDPPPRRSPRAPPSPNMRRRTSGRFWVFLATLAGVAGALVAAAKGLGLFTLEVDREEEEPDTVHCTVFAPSGAVPGEPILIQLFAHLPLQDADARALATEFDDEAGRRIFRGLETPVARGTKLTFELDVPGAQVGEPIQSLLWQGAATPVQFSVVVPEDTTVRKIHATVAVTQASVPLGHITFELHVLSRRSRLESALLPAGDDACRYRSAFLSYATEDRRRVIGSAQTLQAMGIEFFQDILSLSPGERWEQRLYVEIERCDVFLLFWSRSAKASEWVCKEAFYALDCQRAGGAPAIKPLILERPPIDPWPELDHLHFNDRLAHFLDDDGPA